ncbi:MAG: hypothetical protein ACFFCS_03335 [Candidatus Hodarchaeota archaeon]
MQWDISRESDGVVIEAGILKKRITFTNNFPRLEEISIDGINILERDNLVVSARFSIAEPDQMPRGIPIESNLAGISQENVEKGGTDGLKIEGEEGSKSPQEKTRWQFLSTISQLLKGKNFGDNNFTINENGGNSKRIIICIPVVDHDVLNGVQIEIFHEIHEDYPAIHKWLAITNKGDHWLKVDNLKIEPVAILEDFRNHVYLTPSERGAGSCIIAFEHKHGNEGLILCNEIPSALREIAPSGSMGYREEHFEWVIGPGELFVSEPVFEYAYKGELVKTCSSVSKPLDRTVESKFQRYLVDVVGVRAFPEKMPVPLWCTWSNFHAMINDSIIREQAPLAREAGFIGFQIDAGWSNSENPADWTSGSRSPHAEKFPEFEETCAFVRGQGLKLGLWTSCFRNPLSPDLKDMPENKTFPLVKRGECFGMSYASPWRYYYANDVIYLNETFGATYFKQDLTNIKFGDIAEGHESRTRKESLLRAIRGFLETQDIIHEKNPEVCTLMSHELYWGTPGTPCDIAALKHCWSFHIPPNDYSGAYPRTKRIVRKETFLKINKWLLLLGCHNARKRFYAHRGLPLYCIEYYGAATVNKDGSLTPKIQDRQVCSWLMGIPSVYAGDLSSLTKENITHYKKRFDLIKKLQEKHGIYKYFQYSGVPAPTDKGWHWWGKLNPEGSGIVVVMRGFFGVPSKRINIPWVQDDQEYTVRALFKERDLGVHAGVDLKEGKVKISLPRLSQEILEIIACK